jgi:hypothetical protein
MEAEEYPNRSFNLLTALAERLDILRLYCAQYKGQKLYYEWFAGLESQYNEIVGILNDAEKKELGKEREELLKADIFYYDSARKAIPVYEENKSGLVLITPKKPLYLLLHSYESRLSAVEQKYGLLLPNQDKDKQIKEMSL